MTPPILLITPTASWAASWRAAWRCMGLLRTLGRAGADLTERRTPSPAWWTTSARPDRQRRRHTAVDRAESEAGLAFRHQRRAPTCWPEPPPGWMAAWCTIPPIMCSLARAHPGSERKRRHCAGE